jgi:hypothetical protein
MNGGHRPPPSAARYGAIANAFAARRRSAWSSQVRVSGRADRKRDGLTESTTRGG